MSGNICLASCFLRMDNDMVNFWNDFSEDLEKMDYRLVMLVTHENENLKPVHYLIPYSPKEFSDWFDFESVDTSINTSSKFINAIRNDFESHSSTYKDYDLYLEGANSCRLYMKNTIEKLNPSIALLWNLESPQSKIFSIVLDEYEIPFFSFERGLLPDTLMIDNCGINGLSDLNRVFSLKNSISSYNVLESYYSAKEYYNKTRIEKYPQAKILDSYSYRKERMLEGKKIIGFFGQWDYASGFFSEYSNRTRIHSPYFESTAETLFEVAKSLKERDDLVIVFKPHPLDDIQYNEFEMLGNVFIEKKMNMNTLLNEADLFLFNGTTIQFDALFYEKPIILTSNSQLAGTCITYEITSKENIANTINDAILKKGFEDKHNKAVQFISWLLDYYLIKVSENSPAHNSYKELTEFICRTAIQFRQDDVDETLKLFDESMKNISKKTANVI